MKNCMPATRVGGSAAVWILLLTACLLVGCNADLYSKISEQEANEMLAALSQGGIHSSKMSPDGKTWSVAVAETDIPASLEILRAHGLPRDRFHSLGDVFKKEGLVSSPSEERIRFIYAMSQELSNTLSQIDGVVTARVHVVIPSNDPLAEKVTPASASVFIKHRPELNTKVVTPAIKNLVFRSIEGLSYEDISVSFFVSEASSPTYVRVGGAWYESTWFLMLCFVGPVGLLAIALSHPGRRAELKALFLRDRPLIGGQRPGAHTGE